MIKRTKEVERKYQERKASLTKEELLNYDFSNEKEIMVFKRYRIIENSFPYDTKNGVKVLTHHLLVENKKILNDKLDLKNMEIFLNRYYNDMFENNVTDKSVKGTYHRHLLKLEK